MANFKTKYQKHLCQLLLIYVATLHQLFWKLTKEKFNLHEVNFGGAAKIHINPDADVTIKQSIYLVLTNVLSASFLIVYTFDEISLQS